MHTNEDLTTVSKVEPKPMRYAVASLIEWQRRADRQELDALPRAQALADKWVGGIGTILGLFSAVSLVTGPKDVSDLPDNWKLLVTFPLVLAVLSAGAAFFLCATAAWGGGRFRPVQFGAQLRRQTYRRLREVECRLRWGRFLTGIAAVLSVAAVILTWLFTEPDPKRDAPKKGPTRVASPANR